jgi:para-nitrobenzyl esterase
MTSYDLRLTVALIVSAFALIEVAAQPAGAGSPVIRTGSGAVVGDGADVWAFRGIPYAAPPVGELRWRPPASPTPWEGVRKSTSFGADCMQKPGPPTRAPAVNEDCLTVNIWTKVDSAQGKSPVMVFVYGGGFINGSGLHPLYAKPSLAKASCWLPSITEQASLDS